MNYKKLIMNWLFKGNYYNFYLILTVILGLSTYLIFTSVIGFPIKPFRGSISEAIKMCGMSELSELVTPLEKYSLLNHSSTEANSRYLQIGNIKLTASNHFLTAKTKDAEVETSVSQPDYGAILSLHRTKSGEIFAIGEQITYRLEVSIQDRMPVMTEPVPLPLLFSETCGFFGRITRSCIPQLAIYSDELGAIFLNGYSSYGIFTSQVLGLTLKDRDISNSGTPFFMGDIRGTGRVLLSGPQGFALFDGQVIITCANEEIIKEGVD